MNLTETIFARRAIRSYEAQRVDPAALDGLLRAAVQAGVAVAPIIVGYPKAEAPPVLRAEPKIVSWSR